MEERDEVTGLFTRGAFQAALQQAVDDGLRRNQVLALAFGDIDHFKRVNDMYGHQTGDAVLREVARRLETVVTSKGVVYRYGGEELVLILTNHSAEEALAVAERSRRAIEAEPFAGVRVSMSFGVACLPDHASDAAGLVRAADTALYDAKNHGRNLVRLAGEPAPVKPGPREPQRKAAQPGRLTDHQKAELRRRLFRGKPLECPEDGAFLQAQDITEHDSVARAFVVVCPDCGLRDVL